MYVCGTLLRDNVFVRALRADLRLTKRGSIDPWVNITYIGYSIIGKLSRYLRESANTFNYQQIREGFHSRKKKQMTVHIARIRKHTIRF
jgi:hypothetical protein